MNVPTTDNNIRYLEYISFVTRLRDVMEGSKVLQSLFQTSQTIWDSSYDAADGKHLIFDVFTSLSKTEAIKTYIARIVKLYLDSRGNRMVTWSKGYITTENSMNVAITGRIAGTQFKTNYELFSLIATRQLGFDDSLLKYAILQKDSLIDRTVTLFDYLSSIFDIDPIGKKSPHMYLIDESVLLVELLDAGLINNQFIADQISDAKEYFDGEDDGSRNVWEIFALLTRARGDVNSTPESNAFYDKLSSTATKKDSEVFQVTIDRDDADIITTVEMLSMHNDNVAVTLPHDIEYTSDVLEGLDALVTKATAAGKKLEIIQPKVNPLLAPGFTTMTADKDNKSVH